MVSNGKGGSKDGLSCYEGDAEGFSLQSVANHPSLFCFCKRKIWQVGTDRLFAMPKSRMQYVRTYDSCCWEAFANIYQRLRSD